MRVKRKVDSRDETSRKQDLTGAAQHAECISLWQVLRVGNRRSCFLLKLQITVLR